LFYAVLNVSANDVSRHGEFDDRPCSPAGRVTDCDRISISAAGQPGGHRERASPGSTAWAWPVGLASAAAAAAAACRRQRLL